ncbi:MAG: gspD, partial [Verrucomicrobiaceae bacterium]|nr:gspD [Verrucomicrobiaceae bacterium]
MNTFVTSLAALAGLIAVTYAQTAVSTAASSASRLSQMVLDPVPDASSMAYAPTSAGRLSGMLLAQIPQQPAIMPGQNPNTVPPGGRGFGPGGSMHSPGRMLPGPNGGRSPGGPANSVTQSAGTASPTRGPTSASGSAVSGSPVSAPAGSPAPPPQPAVAVQPEAAPDPVVVDPAQQAVPVENAIDDTEMVEVVFQAAPLPSILDKYSDWTGKKVIRDMNVEAVTFTIDSHGALPKRKAIDFLERSLLLNGYGFIPAGEDFVKILNLAAIKPGAEHPVIMKTDDLPDNGEAIVTYVQPLQYLEPDDLKKTLSELVQLHAYGVVTPLPNARGVAITENSNTIRYIIALLKDLDKAPVTTEQRSFQLTRASADDVAKALADILDIEGKGSGGSSGGKKSSSGGTTPAPVPNAIPGQPGGVPQNAAARTGVYGNAPQASSMPPKLIPIPRTNKLLVIARASDLDYIATLITELDGAAELRSFMTRPLKYLAATEILPIIKDAIT